MYGKEMKIKILIRQSRDKTKRPQSFFDFNTEVTEIYGTSQSIRLTVCVFVCVWCGVFI